LAEDDKGMSQNVEFILSLEDKQFTASIDRAGKLTYQFGEQATNRLKKLKTSSALGFGLQHSWRS
jgi:hypothetical protein